MLATHKYLGSKGAEINRNEIFMDLPHISHSFYTPNSPLLLWSDALVLLTFPQTKKIHFGHTWSTVWSFQTGNALPTQTPSVGLEFPGAVQAMEGHQGGVCWGFPDTPPPSLTTTALPLGSSCLGGKFPATSMALSTPGSHPRACVWVLELAPKSPVRVLALIFLTFPPQKDAGFWLDDVITQFLEVFF